MKWKYKKEGIHVHVNVYMNGGFCGKLTFRDYEFEEVLTKLDKQVLFEPQ